MKKDFVSPIVGLVAICLVISLALAFTNLITAPIIAKAEAEAAEQARMEVLPQADHFTLVETEDLPDTVTEVYKADNGAGYVFMLSVKGYGGKMALICGIDSDGKITGCRTLSHAETAGLGSKTAEEGFYSRFDGKDASLEGVDTITGATISSKAYIGGIEAAFAAFDMVKGAE